jgi:dihydroorotate dehydrogenase
MTSVYRVDRSWAWNYGHAPSLPRLRRLPASTGAGYLFGRPLNSLLGVAAGPLLNSKWVEGYARLGFDVLTYATVRSREVLAHALPNIRHVDNREQAAVVTRRPAANGVPTLAVSVGTPSVDPDVWRRDVGRAKEKLRRGQVLIVSVAGTHDPGGTPEALAADYACCAAWAFDAGADAVEVQLAAPNPFVSQPQALFENAPLAALILHGVRSVASRPVVAKLGPFRTPRQLHDTATRLAPWANGFTLVHGVERRVVDDAGVAAFEGAGRERAIVVGADVFPVASRQIAEMLAWRKAGAWDRAILAVGGISTVERAQAILQEGADAVLVATAALYDPRFAARFRAARVSAA